MTASQRMVQGQEQQGTQETFANRLQVFLVSPTASNSCLVLLSLSSGGKHTLYEVCKVCQCKVGIKCLKEGGYSTQTAEVSN